MLDLPTPTGRELEILKVLWDAGPSSVRGVHEAMLEESGEEIAYNTIQTLLRIMESKQLVKHHSEGRTFVYTPRFSKEQSAARFLDRVFDGAASELMLSLIRAERVPADELDRMSTLIARARNGRREGGGR
jgi:BlaI family transcriptional regulator, penicillinase repressor